ncbi:hypothetical protein [Pseudomonas sp. MWU15-20650]|uniref:hypothetical protein n=1 Tax=Pseudomonas sp. MWU15-20650 TaxID=2933107 RepID=UPI00200C8970|nr:hypothetical protein [Pseudomonas sp. MWU15-20650]
MHTCIFFTSSQPTRSGGGGKDAAKEDKEGTQFGKDAIEAMAGMPGNTGKDADAL